jgi:hypothetical protein
MIIPVDSDLRSDPRFRALAKIVGSEADAFLLCFDAWAVAQRYWRKDRSLVPFDVWVIGGFEPLERVALAERRESGIYCKGSSEKYDWYHDKRETASVAGKISAAVRRERFGSAQPKVGPEHTPNERSNDSEQALSRSAERPERARTTSNVTPIPIPTLKEKSNPPRPAGPDPVDLELADEWAAFARSRSDTVRPNREAYAKAMAQMRGLGLSPQDIRDTLAWIRSDDFWSRVAWSPVSLVKSKGGSRKLDTVRAQMAKAKPVAKTSTPFLTLEEIDALDRG